MNQHVLLRMCEPTGASMFRCVCVSTAVHLVVVCWSIVWVCVFACSSSAHVKGWCEGLPVRNSHLIK